MDDTTLPDDSNLSFSSVISIPNIYNQDQESLNFGNISPINNSNSEDTHDSIEVSNNNSNLFLNVLSNLNTATSIVHNNLSNSLGNSIGPNLSNDDTMNINELHSDNTMNINELNSVSNENDPYQANMSAMDINELNVSSDHADTTREDSTFENTTFLGGKKVKKTALDVLINDMNRIAYILKGMKVERKVMNKKSKKNKNKKKNKRTYKKIKRIPRNNRKRSVKKSKK